jgi:hypothetical protein
MVIFLFEKKNPKNLIWIFLISIFFIFLIQINLTSIHGNKLLDGGLFLNGWIV